MSIREIIFHSITTMKGEGVRAWSFQGILRIHVFLILAGSTWPRNILLEDEAHLEAMKELLFQRKTLFDLELESREWTYELILDPSRRGLLKWCWMVAWICTFYYCFWAKHEAENFLCLFLLCVISNLSMYYHFRAPLNRITRVIYRNGRKLS